jgi:hypothetical protein
VNKSVKFFGVGIGAVLVLVLLAIIFLSIKPTKISTQQINPSPTAVVSSPTPTIASKYTSAFRAMARAKFIESCKAKVGQQYTTACNCGADYLAAHYTDAQLEKAYIVYHSSNKIPSEIQAAYDACKNN